MVKFLNRKKLKKNQKKKDISLEYNHKSYERITYIYELIFYLCMHIMPMKILIVHIFLFSTVSYMLVYNYHHYDVYDFSYLTYPILIIFSITLHLECTFSSF